MYIIIFKKIIRPQKKRISVGIVSVFASCAVDRGLKPQLGQAKDYTIGICCFSSQHAVLRSKSKYRLAWNQVNVSEWSNMFNYGLLV